MSVSSATTGRPAPAATSTSAWASASASSRPGRNAPEPSLTSMTSAARPAASFLERIEATISGSDSTVPVASRTAYSRRSAGASSAVCPTIAQPARPTAARRRSRPGVRVVARDRVELVERPAGVAEPAAGDHRHGAAAGGDDRGEHEADLVADAARRVLVEHRAVELRPVQADAGVASSRASAPRARRRASRCRNIAMASAPTWASDSEPSAIPADEADDLGLVERVAVALAADQLRGRPSRRRVPELRQQVVEQARGADPERLRRRRSPARAARRRAPGRRPRRRSCARRPRP